MASRNSVVPNVPVDKQLYYTAQIYYRAIAGAAKEGHGIKKKDYDYGRYRET